MTHFKEGVFKINGKADELLRADEDDTDYSVSFIGSKVKYIALPAVTAAGMHAEAVTHEMAHMCFSVMNNKSERLLKLNHGVSFGEKNLPIKTLHKALDNEYRVVAVQLQIALMHGYELNDILDSVVGIAFNIIDLPAFIALRSNDRKKEAEGKIISYLTEYTADTVLQAWGTAINYIHVRSIYA